MLPTHWLKPSGQGGKHDWLRNAHTIQTAKTCGLVDSVRKSEHAHKFRYVPQTTIGATLVHHFAAWLDMEGCEMNPRIRELARQATVDKTDEFGYWIGSEFDTEKFAELIVRECAELFEIEWGDEKLTGNDVGYVLKKHFGVEE